MAEILQEGLAIAVSLALGLSLLALLHPGVASLEDALTDRGGLVVLDDLANLLEVHEGYSVRLFLNGKLSGSYENGMLTIDLFGRNFSMKTDLGAYQFRIYNNCVLESDGVGWRNVG